MIDYKDGLEGVGHIVNFMNQLEITKIELINDHGLKDDQHFLKIVFTSKDGEETTLQVKAKTRFIKGEQHE